MMREVLVKVSVNKRTRGRGRRLVISRASYTLQTLSCLFATDNRTWCKKSVLSLTVQGKLVTLHRIERYR
jgi:hypothetical protein